MAKAATKKVSKKTASYSEDSIERYAGLAGIRKKPTVYVGPMDSGGMWTICREPLDNVVDQALAGRASSAHLLLDPDGDRYWIVDNGEGIPVGLKVFEDERGRKEKMSTLYVVTGLTHGGGNFTGDNISRGCFAGETKVRLLSGKIVSMAALYKRWQTNKKPLPLMTFNLKKQKIEPSNISHVQLTKMTRELVKIRLDDGGDPIRVTPDHPFYVNREGGIKKVRADKLRPNDSLVSSYYSYDKDGYLCQTEQGSKFRVHRRVAEHVYGREPGVEDSHHISGDKLDNRPKNLEVLTKAAHQREHSAERSSFHREKILIEQEDLRTENSERFTAQNCDDDFIEESLSKRVVSVAVKALIAEGSVTRSSYEKARRKSEPRFVTALNYMSLVEMREAAEVKLRTLHARQRISSKAEDELERLTANEGKSSAEFSADANWKKSLHVWTQHLLSLPVPEDATPEEFNLRPKTSAVVFGRYAQLRQYTSLTKLKAHVLQGKELVLHENQSDEARLRRKLRAEINMRSEASLRKMVSSFASSAIRLSNFTREAYEVAKTSSAPQWDFALELLSSAHGIQSLPEAQTFVRSFNHRVKSVTAITLDAEVPVFDITVDNQHTFFIEPGVLVKNTHGIGIKATNALSKEFTVWTFRDKSWHCITYAHGKIVKDVHKVKNAPKMPHGFKVKSGTVIMFSPDKPLFAKDSKINMRDVTEWCQTTSYLVPKFTIKVTDKKGKTETYLCKRGPIEFIEKRVAELKCTITGKPFLMTTKEIDIAVAFSDAEGSENVFAYTNGLRNVEGGKHIDSFFSALATSLKPYKGKSEYTPTDLKEGLLGLVNYKISAPAFNNQTKDKLVDGRVAEVATPQILAALKDFWLKNKSLAKQVVSRAAELRKRTADFLKDKKLIKNVKNARAGLSAKLADVGDKKVPFGDRELYLVEGDSAGGCFAADTEVLLSNGTAIRFDTMVDDPKAYEGFGFDLGTKQREPFEFDEPRITKYVTELIEIEMSDGTVVRATPDHPWLCADGEYRASEILQVGQQFQTVDVSAKDA